jgi:hypothetical protein
MNILVKLGKITAAALASAVLVGSLCQAALPSVVSAAAATAGPQDSKEVDTGRS